MRITLSLWDIGGQERFNFFKTDFFRGCAAVGLVFDITRPDTFEKIDDFFQEIRERSGNIPIVLVGNKTDLKESVGVTITREEILQKVNQYNLFEYIETSALEDIKVKELFNRLSIISLLDLRPRLGEFVNENHFRFKVLLLGAAAVGKSSLIKTFVDKNLNLDYKLTIGLDFMTQNFEILDDDIPNEVRDIIQNAISSLKKKKKEVIINYESQKSDLVIKEPVVNETITRDITEEIQKDDLNRNKQKSFPKIYLFLAFIILGIISILSIIIIFNSL